MLTRMGRDGQLIIDSGPHPPGVAVPPAVVPDDRLITIGELKLALRGALRDHAPDSASAMFLTVLATFRRMGPLFQLATALRSGLAAGQMKSLSAWVGWVGCMGLPADSDGMVAARLPIATGRCTAKALVGRMLSRARAPALWKLEVLVTETDVLLRLRAVDEDVGVGVDGNEAAAWPLMRLLVMVIDILFFLSCLTWRK